MSEITDDIIRANFEPQWKYGDIDAVKADIARLTAELAAALKRAEAAEQSESGLARALTTAMAELVALREQTRWIPVSEKRYPIDCDNWSMRTINGELCWAWLPPFPQPPEDEND